MILGIDIFYGTPDFRSVGARIERTDGVREYSSFVGWIPSLYPRLDVTARDSLRALQPRNAQVLVGGAAMLMLGMSQAQTFHVFDARGVAGRFRHSAIFGVLDALQPGECMRFVNDHDPLPLLERLRQRFGENIDIHYRQSEPGWIVIDFRLLG